MTARCPSCTRTAVLNAHHGICNVCLMRAKRLATGYLAPREWRGDRTLLAVARRLRDQIPERDRGYNVATPRSQDDQPHAEQRGVCDPTDIVELFAP